MRKLIFAALVSAGLAGPARTDPVTEALFAEGIFDDAPEGQQIVYRHVRSAVPARDILPMTDGRIELLSGQAKDGARNLSLTIEGDGQRRDIVEFPASAGNPVLMVFLESTVRSMAAITGGSPFYIRNRIKDALRGGGGLADVTGEFAGAAIPAREVKLRPFETDPNRERMGEFGGLVLTFVISDAVPGHFMRLAADIPDVPSGYHETITLTEVREGP